MDRSAFEFQTNLLSASAQIVPSITPLSTNHAEVARVYFAEQIKFLSSPASHEVPDRESVFELREWIKSVTQAE
jgi:hypothetical protein